MSSRESKPPPEPSPASPKEGDGPPRISPEVVRAYLGRAATLAWLHKRVARKIPAQQVQDVANDVAVEAMATPFRPYDEKALRGWLQTVADRIIADLLAKRTRRKKYEGAMPAAAASEDDYTGQPVADADDLPPGAASLKAELDVEGRMASRWLQAQVKGNARDEETLEILVEYQSTDKTYAQIAKERGKSASEVAKQVFHFKEKYTPRYNRFRERAFLLLLLGGAALVAIAYLVWRLLHPASETRPLPALTPSRPPGALTVKPGPPEGDVGHAPPREDETPAARDR
jgi:DNA-directed RNA polymerase specialized sigma24 family protein